MKQGVFSAKVDTCLLYWCAAYMWIARGARTNVPSLHSSRKWSLRLHSLRLWVTCWETQAWVSVWPFTAWFCGVAGLQNLSRPTGDRSAFSHWKGTVGGPLTIPFMKAILLVEVCRDCRVLFFPPYFLIFHLHSDSFFFFLQDPFNFFLFTIFFRFGCISFLVCEIL